MSSWVRIILRHKVVIMGENKNKRKLGGHMQNTKESDIGRLNCAVKLLKQTCLPSKNKACRLLMLELRLKACTLSILSLVP